MLGAYVLHHDIAVCVDDHDRIRQRIHDAGKHLPLLIEPARGEPELFDCSHAREHGSGKSCRLHQVDESWVVDRCFDQYHAARCMTKLTPPVRNGSPANLAALEADQVELCFGEQSWSAAKLR